jgi:ankyrin repeat protein
LPPTYLAEDRAPKPGVSEQEIESAFRHACGIGHLAAAQFLLSRGVDTNARDDDGRTGLHASAYGAHAEVVKLLLTHRARVDVKEKRYGARPLDVTLWIWSNRADLAERCYEIAALLTRAGAKFEPQQWRDPESGECPMLERVRSDARMFDAIFAAL